MFLLALENSVADVMVIVHSVLKSLSGTAGLENCRLEHAAILHSPFRILSGAFVLEN